MPHLTKTFVPFIAFQGPRNEESTQENRSPTSTIVAAVVSVAGVAILIASAVFCWRRYRGFYVTLTYLTKCRRYSNLLRRLLSLNAGNDVMKISIFPSCSKSGALTIYTIHPGWNFSCKYSVLQLVETQIGKIRRCTSINWKVPKEKKKCSD